MTGIRGGRGPGLALLLVTALVARLPLLGRGFGSDDDAWRNVVAALRMRELGEYLPSRLPGFPVYEGLLLPLAPWGWVATNAMSLAAALAAVWLFHRICRALDLEAALPLSFAFAFSAPLWVHASQTMDYAPGIALLLASYDQLLRRRPAFAGVLLALAAGCRPTLGFLVAPALLLLLARRDERRALVAFGGSFVLAAAAVFSPVFLTTATGGFAGEFQGHMARHHAMPAELPGLLRRAAVFLLTKPGLLVLAAAGVGLAARALRRGAGARRSRGAGVSAPVLFEAGTIAVLGIFFLLIPYELAYLMPALPMILLLAGRLLPRGWILALGIAMLSESLVTGYADARRVSPGRLFQERAQRQADLDYAASLSALRPEAPTVFLVSRFAVHRLLLLDPELEPTEAAWAPFRARGVALWNPDRRMGFASDLDEVDREALEGESYRIEDLQRP